MNASSKIPGKKWTPLKETRSFIKQVRDQFFFTGAILPSSKYLARAICSTLKGKRDPWNILEVGPGTGAITREIAKVMQPEDSLCAIEINQDFADHLQADIDTKKDYEKSRKQIKVHVGRLEDMPGEGIYDCIISGLPMNNFDSEMVTKIFQVFRRLIKPGASLSYYEYLAIRDLKYPFVKKSEKVRLKGISDVVSQEIRNHQVKVKRVWLNVPPAVVRTLILK